MLCRRLAYVPPFFEEPSECFPTVFFFGGFGGELATAFPPPEKWRAPVPSACLGSSRPHLHCSLARRQPSNPAPPRLEMKRTNRPHDPQPGRCLKMFAAYEMAVAVCFGRMVKGLPPSQRGVGPKWGISRCKQKGKTTQPTHLEPKFCLAIASLPPGHLSILRNHPITSGHYTTPSDWPFKLLSFRLLLWVEFYCLLHKP